MKTTELPIQEVDVRKAAVDAAVIAYKHIFELEQQIDQADDRLTELTHKLDDEQFQEYVEKTTEFDREQSKLVNIQNGGKNA